MFAQTHFTLENKIHLCTEESNKCIETQWRSEDSLNTLNLMSVCIGIEDNKISKTFIVTLNSSTFNFVLSIMRFKRTMLQVFINVG